MSDKTKALVSFEYETDTGTIKLTPETVKRYLVNGEPDKVTDQEVMMFLALCKYQKLNPFLREAYLIKYGNEPATIVTGKETFTKRAAKNELCTGWQAGVIVQKKDGNIEYRNGTLVLPNEELVGGWARVSRKDWKEPLEITVSLKEYERKKRDGTLMRNWREMPATMIRKVALVQALREAFPETFQGMYSPEEMPIDDSQLPTKTIDVEYTETNEEAQKEDLATELQRKKIYAMANKLGYDKETMHAMISERYGKESSKELTKSEASDLIEHLAELEKQMTIDAEVVQ
ncbi:phage recombination protein Bet [Carboxydothermus islandicus]|uniref:Phage recombination protein Bet n=1 Tax=Carboxydothermus islandicus TaxID=661089 RepID=A0A1L8D0X5_9THEO|nr:phage recombination protein Bet [Carboxydothermus islandicus]GAV24777.1 phage recombination protein Bet [Carboxydothermus islandicus]